jgi:hypothetical protein
VGPAWLGVRARPSLTRARESREEWLEAIRLLGFPLFPLRRFVLYRNLDTGEVGQGQRLPLKISHYLWQMAVVVLLSFALLGGVLRAYPNLVGGKRPAASDEPTMSPQEREAAISRAVERLKRLAEVEAQLRKQPAFDRERLQIIETERQALIDRVQQLEQGG